MTPTDAPARIHSFDAGREPERLKLKYKGMRKTRSAFLRGTCHLFYEDWPRSLSLNNAPLAWLCGDLHFENFGAYKCDNRAVYFDITDFDESVLGPCTWDVARFLTSVLVTARDNKLPTGEGNELCEVFISNYFACLGAGKARWVERPSPLRHWSRPASGPRFEPALTGRGRRSTIGLSDGDAQRSIRRWSNSSAG